MNRKTEHPSYSKNAPSADRKPFTIAVVALVAVVLLVLLFFAGKQFVGKAIYTIYEGIFAAGEGGNIDPLEVPVPAGRVVTVSVGANPGRGTASTGFEFELEYPEGVLSFVDLTSPIDWSTDFIRTRDTGSSVQFEYATIDYSAAITGPVHLAEVIFRVREGQELSEGNLDQLSFSGFTVWSLSDDPVNLITTIVHPNGEVEVVGAGAPLMPQQRFLGKVTALINGECYTDSAGGGVLYCPDGNPRVTYDEDGELDASEKIYVVTQLGTALREFFAEVVAG